MKMSKDIPKLLEKLKTYVENSPLSQNKIAAKTGYDPSMISRLLNGERNISDDFIKKFCNVLQLGADEETELLNLAGYQSDVVTYSNDRNTKTPGKIIKQFLFEGKSTEFYAVISDLQAEAHKLISSIPVWRSPKGVTLSFLSGWSETCAIVSVTQFDFSDPYRFGRKAMVIALMREDGLSTVLFVDGCDSKKIADAPPIGEPFVEFADFIIEHLKKC